ncbi:MAG: hypothetical protein KR126chlam6_00622 [Candidatus Anoxychlamydiales bacterium]|nr:hypothetical protein [Candidatus Anoxychlamydiales bacterium]
MSTKEDTLDVFGSVRLAFITLNQMLDASDDIMPELKNSLMKNLFPNILDTTSLLKERSEISPNIRDRDLKDMISFLFLSIVASSKALAEQLNGRHKGLDIVSQHYLTVFDACNALSEDRGAESKTVLKATILGILSLFKLEIDIRNGNSLEDDSSPDGEDLIATLRDSPRPYSEGALPDISKIGLIQSKVKEMQNVSFLIRALVAQSREVSKRLAAAEESLARKYVVISALEEECDRRKDKLTDLRLRFRCY